MTSLDKKQKEWIRYRRQLERETQLLVVEEDQASRKRFEDFLYRHRLQATFVDTPEAALEQLDTLAYPLVMVSETFSGLGGIYFIRKIRADYPDIDTLISSANPTVELVAKAFELRIFDVIQKPLTQFEVFGQRIRDALRRSVNRRMRSYALMALRDHLQHLDPEPRLRTTAFLEQQLGRIKTTLGRFNRILIIEEESSIQRMLGEDLLLADFSVESAFSIREGLTRIAAGGIHLVVVPADRSGFEEQALRELLQQIKQKSPLTELMLVSSSTDPPLPLAALRQGIAFFLSWPPHSPAAMILRLKDILHRCLREQLMDNLLAELYWETNRALGHPSPEESFESFRRLIGLEHVQGLKPVAGLSKTSTAEIAFLDDVLDNLLSQDGAPFVTQEVLDEEAALEADGSYLDRRSSPRVLENQFVRFRPLAAQSSILALVGDLSTGGLFIRTPDLLLPGTMIELDINAEYEGKGYLVRCRGQVAWIARDDRQFTLGPGFGVKFVHPPPDVSTLIQSIVSSLLKSDG